MNGHDIDRRDHDSPMQPVTGPETAAGPTGSDMRNAPVPPPRPFGRLRQRSEFLAVAKGVRVHDAAFTLQAIRRDAAQEAQTVPRFGLTVTKKTGNSVVRNRIRRRMREMLRHSPASCAQALPDGGAFDYVIVARREALTRRFDELARDLERSLKRAQGRLAPRLRNAPAPQDNRQDAPDRQIPQSDEKPGPTS